MNAKIMDAMLRHGVGLNPWFFERNEEAAKFPPHNITQVGEDRYRLTLAVAGFRQDDLEITLQGELLTISGHRTDEARAKVSKEGTLSVREDKILYKGIAERDFVREFMIGENVNVESAMLQHGLLEIDLQRRIPESQKSKLIPITG
jgi:molecular chaperone IbpA